MSVSDVDLREEVLRHFSTERLARELARRGDCVQFSAGDVIWTCSKDGVSTARPSWQGRINISKEEADSIINDICNGTLEDVSAGKGGRAWLDGEWQLCELEALCVVLRHTAKEAADGAEDLAQRMRGDD